MSSSSSNSLPLLPDDCYLSILIHVAGPPPIQATTLAYVAMCCWRLWALSELAAAELVEAHMHLVRVEEAALPEAVCRHLEPVPSSGGRQSALSFEFFWEVPLGSAGIQSDPYAWWWTLKSLKRLFRVS